MGDDSKPWEKKSPSEEELEAAWQGLSDAHEALKTDWRNPVLRANVRAADRRLVRAYAPRWGDAVVAELLALHATFEADEQRADSSGAAMLLHGDESDPLWATAHALREKATASRRAYADRLDRANREHYEYWERRLREMDECHAEARRRDDERPPDDQKH